MYAETGESSPYMQKVSQDFQLFEEFCETRKPNASMMSTISDYYLGGESDLFKAPEPIIEEPIVGYDPMTSTISLSLCGEVGFTSQGLKAADIESIQNEQLLEVLYECEKDLMAKAVIETPLSEKSVSSDCLSSMEWTQGAAIKPNFLDFPGMDLDSANGMRRAFSEGDIKKREIWLVKLREQIRGFRSLELGLRSPLG